jgi:hypothetical protein
MQLSKSNANVMSIKEGGDGIREEKSESHQVFGVLTDGCKPADRLRSGLRSGLKIRIKDQD